MNSEQCTYSQDTAADCSQIAFSDTGLCAQWSGTHTLAKSCANVPQTDGSQDCQCGKGMFDCSIHPNTPDKWIAYMQDFLAKTLALLESRQVYLREPDQVFTEKSCALLASLSPDNSFWKMCQQSFLTDSEPYSQTWPRWGMTAAGCVYAHPMSERRITETDGSYLPTPVSIDAGTGRFNTSIGSSNHRPTLAMMAKNALWPTPLASDATKCASDSLSRAVRPELRKSFRTKASQVCAPPAATDYKGSPSLVSVNLRNQASSRGVRLPEQIALVTQTEVGGKLNPAFVEWLMAFPIGFTDLKDSAMLKCQSKPQQPTACSEESK